VAEGGLRGDAWPVVFDAALGDVAVEEVLDSRVREFRAAAAGRVPRGLRPGVYAGDRGRGRRGWDVLRRPPDPLRLVDSRVAFDGVQGEVQPPGALAEADARVE
jgi:hypothetical protein